jgi:GDP-mannose 6-dehydrogenase
MSEVLDHAEILVIGNGDPEFKTLGGRLKSDQKIIEFVSIRDNPKSYGDG